MTISPEAKQKIQLFLVAAIVITGVRAGYIIYQRKSGEAAEAKKAAAPPLNADYYVTPKKLYPYDLKSAKQLTQQPVWAKEGYRYTYYPFDAASKKVEFGHEMGTLLPLQKLEVKDVVTDVAPGAGGRQVLAVYEDRGKTYAVPIGSVEGESYHIYSDEMFFIQDPHDLYKHWSAETWAAIDKHEMKTGMNELQADFAIGMGVPEPSGDASMKTVNYPNGGHPVTVVYQQGKAAEIKAGG
jgi:hypothetical protein